MIVSEDTHKRLMDLGRKSESFNDIICRVLDEYESSEEVEG